ncbi:uroporphyrinogen-III C-methyltransferase [Porphyromonas sp.]|uniref:uroporphyrinogen-III C-methyltransferase n=1 Tax=Porphyromonas sp. TaxID=1924944 RepID=UPI0026DC0936|nr:uroporphyrinogen-III C-methyltransferase [Porphyromonas sp.]MDO4771339.1 uroporphyrinogen-III C-methyltransferase [Porphyromonas sp.]
MTSDTQTTYDIPEGTLVSLVGAGPGDPTLLTLKAIQCLRQADAIFYDALVNPIILSHCRQGIERIPVGKRCGRHSHEQGDINSLLVDRALRGGRIVRLKGGDPFVFGRGGEELQALTAGGIPFEVVPGITAGNSVTTYSGIPVTHRGMSRSVTFITASTKEYKHEATSWKSLVDLKGTIVFYMGATIIPLICERLIAAGLDPNTPACVITEGTLPSQRRLVAGVGDFTPDFTDYSTLVPGLFVVGEVVSFTDEFSFFAPTPLSQVKILAISVDTERSALHDLLGDKVAYIHSLPTSTHERDRYTPALEAKLSQITPGAWVAFTTTASVDYLVEMLIESGRDIRSLSECKIAAIGKTTTNRLRSYGIVPDFVPTRRDRQGLIDGLVAHIGDQPATIVFPHGAYDSETPPPAFPSSPQLSVIDIPLYHSVKVSYTKDDVTFFKEIGFTHIVFSSSKAVDNFAELMEKYGLHSIPTHAKVITYGPSTTERLKAYGIETYCTLSKSTPQDIAQAVIDSL